MGEWNKVKVGDIGRVITGKTPKTSNSEYYGGNIPFLTPSDDMSVKYVRNTNKYITEAGRLSVKNATIPQNSICVSCIGSDLGKVVITTQETVTNQQINSIIVDESKFDIDFIYYSMLELGKLLNFHSKTSTAVPIVNKSSFSQYEICCPDLRTQKKIGSILTSIDKKIELNNNINSNLEQQAYSMYQALFSSDNQANGVLSDIADITMGQSPSGDSLNEESGTVFYQGRTDFTFRFPSVRLFTTEPKRMALKNDVLLSVRAPVGDINVALDDCCIGRGLAAIHPKDNKQSFVYYTAKALYPAFDMFNGEGTVFGSINKVALNSMPIYIPDTDEIDKFEHLVSPMDRLILENHQENMRLQGIRDNLLPKLMSGEIDLSNIDI